MTPATVDRHAVIAGELTSPQRLIGSILRNGLERKGRDPATVRDVLTRYRADLLAARIEPTPRPTLARSGLGLFRYIRRHGTAAERQAAAALSARAATERMTFNAVKAAGLALLEPDATADQPREE